MEKKTIVAIVLVVIIVAAVIIIVTSGKKGAPSGVAEKGLKQPRRVMVVSTREIVNMTEGEWQKLQIDPATGYRVDDQGRKLAIPIKCISCGKEIPPAPIPKATGDQPPREELRKWEYKCPICGKPAYREGLGPKPPAP